MYQFTMALFSCSLPGSEGKLGFIGQSLFRVSSCDNSPTVVGTGGTRLPYLRGLCLELSFETSPEAAGQNIHVGLEVPHSVGLAYKMAIPRDFSRSCIDFSGLERLIAWLLSQP